MLVHQSEVEIKVVCQPDYPFSNDLVLLLGLDIMAYKCPSAVHDVHETLCEHLEFVAAE